MQGNASEGTGTSTNNNNRKLDFNQPANISVLRITRRRGRDQSN